MKCEIEINSLTKSFGDITAVDHLDLRVKSGTIFGLIGPDGAGKTTTMRMLCSLISPDSGTAKIGGNDIITDSEKIKLDIGYMPQRFSLYGDLTVLENLIFYAEIYQVPKNEREKKISYLLKFSNLEKHSYKLADQLSGGMKQKLALACNLIHTPKYLFLDEPTIGVDPVARRELWKILFELKEKGVTIFVSTPYMDEAERCDEIGLISNGRIIKKDTPNKIIKDFTKHIISLYSTDNYKAKDFLISLDYIEDAYLLGEELHIVVDNYEDKKGKIMRDFKENNIGIYDINLVNPSFEDVFVNIVKNEKDRL
ncbi:putative ABC transporter ATP-binding protein YbhF [Clostridium liquoris]|uniref:Putative ABC transporter ATP-binding protein YbhF n=1 Tax=Clostridium liquoris TaxID=1289519 RepID=A0A2T0B263_9CLOT|nr:ABC transporter ATP-binding protein [Clostridium liquoris]PRR77978.1 putative ABC transporter ATP-binding protein YbhF [Clostridium liquoris]